MYRVFIKTADYGQKVAKMFLTLNCNEIEII